MFLWNWQETGGYYAFVEFEELSGVHNALRVGAYILVLSRVILLWILVSSPSSVAKDHLLERSIRAFQIMLHIVCPSI